MNEIDFIAVNSFHLYLLITCLPVIIGYLICVKQILHLLIGSDKFITKPHILVNR